MYLTLTWRSVERGAAFLDKFFRKVCVMRSSVVWKRKQHAILLDNKFFDCTTHPSYRTSTRTVKTTRLLLAINRIMKKLGVLVSLLFCTCTVVPVLFLLPYLFSVSFCMLFLRLCFFVILRTWTLFAAVIETETSY